ncbi:MAG: deoxyribose-phosphate aldolase [Oscillochloridaceae bacterium umkhey_bin13]
MDALIEQAAQQLAAVNGLPAGSQLPRPQPDPTTPLARLIDHTLLRPEATPAQIVTLCAEARRYGFASVCVNPSHVARCANLLADSGVAVCTVIGFPLGATSTSAKAFEAGEAVSAGARELDMVINVGMLKAGELRTVTDDIFAVVAIGHGAGAIVKVIIETALLNEREKILACLLAMRAGADFVKTSTGFLGGGATVADIQLMRRVVGPERGVKASGGIRSLADALALRAAGADRLGASAGVTIMQEAAGQAGTAQPGDGY